jgi:hypothetical protein
MSSYLFGLFYLDFICVCYTTLELPKLWYMLSSGVYCACPWFQVPGEECIEMKSSHAWLLMHLIGVGLLTFSLCHMYSLRSRVRDLLTYQRAFASARDLSGQIQIFNLISIVINCINLGSASKLMAASINLGICLALYLVSGYWEKTWGPILYVFILTAPSMGSLFLFIRFCLLTNRYIYLLGFILVNIACGYDVYRVNK